MREGMLHIHDVEGPKKTGSMEARLEAMEQQVFKCQGMVERGLNANHMMIMEFTNKHKIDANDIGKHLSRLYDRIDHLQAQIYDLQNQNCGNHTLKKTVKPVFVPKASGESSNKDEDLKMINDHATYGLSTKDDYT
ncbi:40S ribosomal protein S5-1 [Hordeum vulgare]|nr:40S ribosomal protein S5-1 [Hordeum vulgare]